MVLLFAGLFWMHVVPLVSTDGAVNHGTASASVMEAGTSSGTELADATLVSAGSGGVPAPEQSSQASVHGSTSGHGAAAHVWAACLAIVVVTIAFGMATCLRRRTAELSLREATSALRWPVWLTPPRPPELSALCLLRI